MSISNWFQNWLTARKAEQRAAAPDHSVRLFVRCLEDRQVLSVSAVLVGTDVTFLGDDGGVSADSIVFTVDIDGNLEHNLGGTNGFHSNLDLDNTLAGDQILAVDDITQLSVDLGADGDSVDFADHFNFAAGSLSVTAESISATLGSLSVQGLARFDAGSANSLSLLGVNDFHQIQIVSANNVFLNDINDLEFSGASVISGDLEVTFRSLVTDQITNSAGASLSVGDLASFSGGSISLGEAAGDSFHFGRLHLDAVGTVAVEEDSATQLFGDVFASELRLVSAGDITDTTGAIQITGLASFSGTAISLGGVLIDTDFGSLNFSSTGAVTVQEDSATELVGDNDALSLQIESTGDLTDTSTSLMVSDLAQFEGTSITLGGATSTTELGQLTFSTPGDVSIQVDAATQLVGDNAALSLVLDSAGAISDSSNSLSVTNHAELSGSSVAIGGAGSTTNFGSLQFHSTGAVTVQEDSSTQVSAASTAGSLDLQSTGQVQLDATLTVTNGAWITADGAITVSAAMSSGGTTSVTSQHEVTVDAVIEGSTVTIEAGDDIAVHARIEAVDAIELTAGTDGSGSVETALAGDLIASNVSSTATIQIASGATGGSVLLAGATTADSLVNITSASEINGPGLITTSAIELSAVSGIGTAAALRLSGATITAQSTDGNIDLGNAVAATYAQVSTGTGTIAIFNTGAAVFTSVTTTDGAIHLVAVDGDLTVGTNVSAGGADADDDVTLLNASGNIVLTGTTSASGNEVLAISDGSISGAGLVSADDVDLQAETGITANLAAENIRVTTTSGGVQLSNTAISPQTTLDLTTGGDAQIHNTGALSIVGTVDGNLTVTVDADDLTDSGPLSVTGTSSLSAAGDVILDHASNDFGGAVAVSGQTVELIDANSLTLGQIDAVTVQVTASGPITLGTGAGEDLVATDCVQLHANSGGVVQRAGSTILTDRLALTGTGPFTLEQANDVAVLAVDIDGSIHFSDSNALIVGTACRVSGLATSGQDARLSTGGNLTIGEAGDLGANDVSLGAGDLTLDVTGSITQLTGNTITATGLQLLGSGGPAQLSESNTVATLAADRDGTIEFINSAALTVGTVTDTAGTLAASTSGVTTSGDDVRLTVLGDLLIDKAISLGAGSLSLNVTGTISQNAGDTITATGLSLSGSGAGSGAVLGEANDIDTFASEYQGLLLLSDIDDLTVGAVTAVGVTTTGISTTFDTKLTTGGDLHLAEAVDLGPGNLLLDVNGAVTQSASGTIQAAGLALLVTGTTTLDQANDVDTVAADTQGSVQLNDIDDLTVGSVTCGTTTVTGVSTTVDVKLVTGGDLHLAEAVKVGPGNLLLDVDGAVTQSATGTIQAAGLALIVSGPTTLDLANDVDTLAADTQGAVLLNDVDDLTVGSVTCGSVTITGISTNLDTKLITGGNLHLAEAIDLGPGSLLLDVDGSVTQSATGTITAAGLALMVTGSTTLDQTNDVDTLAADTQDTVLFNDVDDLTVGSVTGFGMTLVGILTTFDTKLVTGGNLTLTEAVNVGPGNVLLDVDGAITQTASGTIQAGGLALLVTGNTTLDQANDVDRVAADTQGSVLFHDVDDLTVGTVTCGSTSVVGISTTLDTKLIAGGDLHVAERIDLGPGNLLLDVDRAVTQSATGTITATGLALRVTGSTTLDQANDVDTIAADTQGSIQLRDVDDLIVGSVTCGSVTITGISTNFDTKLITGGNLHLAEAIDLGPGNLFLDVDGSVTQSATGTITAAGLALMVTGSTALDQANDVDTLAAETDGTLLFNDVDDLTVGSVTSLGMTVTGLATTFDTKLVTGGNLHLDADIDLGPGNLFLDVDGALTQSASGTITAAGLALQVTGSTTLDQANDVDTLAAETQGAVIFHDIDDLTVGSVTALAMTVSGLATTFDTKLITGGNLHLAEAVGLGAGNLLLNVDGTVTQSTSGTIQAAGLALLVTGSTTLDQANDVDTLAAEAQGTVLFHDIDDLAVGSVTCGSTTITGILSTFDTRLVTGGDLHLAEAVDLGLGNLSFDVNGTITQSAAGTITAVGLALRATGSTTLDQANDVDTLAADTQGSVQYSDVDDLTVGSVTSRGMTIIGLSTTSDAKLVTGGNLLLAEAVDLGSGNLLLSVDGNVTQSAGGTITAAGLALMVTGSTTLDQDNDVDTLAAETQGSVQYSDIDDLTVGSITSLGMTVTGIRSTFDAQLVTGGNLHFDQAVDLGPGKLLLDVDGAVTQSATGTIIADGLALVVTGSTTLDQANDVDTLAAETQGTLLFNDVDDLTVGSVTSLGMTVTGITSMLDAKLVTGGDLHLAKAVDLGPGNLFLDVDGAVTQLATGTITASGLALMVSGSTTLDQTNDVDTLAADTQGSVEFHDIDDLHIGIVSENASPANMTITGVTVDDADFTVSVGTGNLTLDQAISTGAGDVRLEATTGSILDGQDGLTRITAHNLSLTAQTQIGDIVDFAAGTGDAIDVSLTGQLTQASVTDAGGEIFLNFHGDLRAASGSVNVGGASAASAILRATGGDIDVGTAIGVFSLSSGDNLALEAIEIAGAGGTLVLPDAGLDVGVGDLRLRGDVDVRDAADRNLGLLVADDLHFTSGAGSGDTTLTTRINTLTAQITGSGAGLTVLEADGLVLTDIDLVDGDLAVHASQTAAGDIQVIDVSVGDARITLDTTAHGGGQIVDADPLDDPNTADLTATEIDLRAGTGIANGAKLEIAADRLAATTVSGQINVRDVSGDLTIAALAGGTTGVSVTAGVAGDDICISTVGALTVDAEVSNAGTGDREILLAADGNTTDHDLTVNADITATGGNSSITLLAGDSILFAGTTVTSAAGTGAVQARAGRVFQNGGVESAGSASGDILMSDGSIIQSDNGTITLSAPNDIQLSVVNANAAGVDGDIVLTADADGSGTGQIREVLSGELANLIADHVTLSAATGIGTAGAGDIDTTIASIEATNTTSGSIFIHEIDALAITGTGLQTLAGNGDVHVTVDAGPLTVDSVVTAHGSGDVTLTAASGAAELNAEIRSTTGNIQVAGDSVAQNSDITTGGAGTIQVVADTGSITMADGTQTSTELGSIDYSAVGDIAISLIRSDSGPISITADSDNSLDGAIIDNTASETANLATDGTLTLLAATGIGSGDDLNTDIGLLIATNTTSGDIAIREADGLIVTGSGVRTQGGNGNISLVVDDGALVVNSLVAAQGSGNVTLEATQGPAELNAAVRSTSGNLAITANAVNQNTGGDLETGSNGTIEVTADAGSITMADGTTATTSAGNILYSATADVRLSHLSSRSGDLTVRAGHGPSGAGAIIDNTADELPNLQTSGSATLIAETGIGAGDDIDTAVSRLDVTNSTSGAIQITDVDAVQIVQLSQAGGGNVFVQTTNGSITVDNANVTPHAITVSGGGSLVLDANGAGANIIVNDGIQSIGGDITLLADRNIETNSAAVATTGGDGDLTFVAGRDIRVLDPGNLNPIDLQVTGSGTVSLRAANELVLGSQNPRDPNAVQHTTLNDVVVASETGRITNTLPILFDVRSPQITSEGEAVLSVTIGRPGETNLAVRVYWGDGTVETFTGLAAGTYTYRHFYTKNPDPLDPAAPILVNVQVAHDPKILLFAPNVNSSVLSVRNSAVDVPPPVPTPNINADLAKAIYNSGDPLFATLQAQIVSSPGSEAAPGTVVFQDTTFLATTIPVPGEGLATFVFDTTPPVVLLTIPEGVKIVDTQPASTVQVSEGNSDLLVAEAGDDTTSGERQVILEVISPTGEVIQQAVLPESTLDDLQAIIGRLPDGQYRFQLREAGEDRLRLLLEFEVRQGKIADETDAADRPPSTKKPAAEPMDPDSEEEASDPNEARLLLPELPDDDNSAHSPATSQPTRTVSMAVRRAWKQAAEVMSRDNPLDESDPAGQTAQDESDTPAAAWGVMVAVVGAGLAVQERSRSQQALRPQLSRVSRLLRRVRSADSGQSTATRPPDENELAMPMVLPLGEWTSC